MEDKTNTIELIGIKKTRPVLSCVRHHIERWVERQQTLLFYPKSSSYRVTITHEPDAPVFTCEVQINIGSTRWTGCESGKADQCLDEILELAPKGTIAIARLEKDEEFYRCAVDLYSKHGPFIARTQQPTPLLAIYHVRKILRNKFLRMHSVRHQCLTIQSPNPFSN